ncbi:MAG: alkaline phosphatase [Opitutales bacterium]
MSEQDTLPTRRQFLKGVGLVGATSTLLPLQSSALAAPRSGRAKNLIFMVADGMCHGTLGLAHHWNLRNVGLPLNWMMLYDRSDLRRSYQDTASASSPVTDSAAAASSWGCGQRVMNGSINTAADGSSLKPLYDYAREAGKATGLVTTCTITHATPAGFATNVPKRGMEDVIARQYLEREVDVLLGGGRRYFKQAGDDGTITDYIVKYREAGYAFAENRASLKALSSERRKILGLFAEGHMPYAIDRRNDKSLSDIPALDDMFEAALNALSGARDGFVLQVEAGRVDHAGHANDAGAILHELLEFDSCIPIALEYTAKHPDTMLIVTTDHGTGGCQLDGSGAAYVESGPALDRINLHRYSFEWLEKRFRATGQFNAQSFTMATGIRPCEEQAAAVQAALDDPELKYLTSAMTEIFDKELKVMSSVGWSSNKHTAENVELLALGPGSQGIPAQMQNFDLHGIIRQALGI